MCSSRILGPHARLSTRRQNPRGLWQPISPPELRVHFLALLALACPYRVIRVTSDYCLG